MLKIRGLEKTYPGGVRALKGVSLDVPAGMFGLLGPNGAGKTTLMKIMATLLEPDAGTVEAGGVDLVADKA
ncbi:MAG TPA: ATP-binding cassette domain-containing protein, partial [Pyrinomonadaceae bacterium]